MRAYKTVSALFALLLAAAAAAPAQAPDPGLRGEVEALYTVAPAPGGLRLTPIEPRHGVDSITLAGDTVRVNDAKVTAEVLRTWVGADAEAVLRLAALPPAGQRRLFGLDPGGLPEERAAEAERPAVEAEPGEGEMAAEGEAGPAPLPELPEPPEPPEPGELPEPSEPPARPRVYRTGPQFTMFDDLVVGADESAQEAVAVFGSVRVEGEVRGDVTAVFGSVWVDGRVDREVVAVFGSVYLGPEAEVVRGVTAVGGDVEQDEGSIVRGPVTEVPLTGVPRVDHEWPGGHWHGPWWLDSGRGWGGVWSLYWRVIGLVLWALFLGVTLLVAPRVVERVAARSAAEWWQAGLAGLLALVLFVPAVVLVCVVLAITIIGCALIPFVAIAAVILPLVAVLVGYAGISLCVGRWLVERFGWGWTSPYAQLLAGLGALEALRFAGGLAVAAGGWISPVGWLLLGLGSLVRFIAVMVGIGAWILNRFARPAAAPIPPPPAEGAGEGDQPTGTLPAAE